MTKPLELLTPATIEDLKREGKIKFISYGFDNEFFAIVNQKNDADERNIYTHEKKDYRFLARLPRS